MLFVPPRVVRFVVVVALLHAGVFAGVARGMLSAVRADGGTWPEFMMFAEYGGVLMLGVALSQVIAFVFARRALSERIANGIVRTIAVLTTLALLVDVATFLILGMHPYGRATWSAVSSTDFAQLVGRSAVYAIPLALLLGVVAVVELLWILARRGLTEQQQALSAMTRATRSTSFALRVAAYFVLALVVFVAFDRPDDERLIPRGALPFYSLLFASHSQFPVLRPAYSRDAAAEPVTFARTPDIVVLQAESLRWDMLTAERMPHLWAMSQRESCTSLPRHYAGGHLTQYGTYALLYGNAPSTFLPLMTEGRESDPLSALRHAGYTVLGFDASGVLGYTIPPIAPAQFARYETLLAQDSTIIAKTLNTIDSAPGTPKFVFGFVFATHAMYAHPAAYNQLPQGGRGFDAQQAMFNSYKNSVRYVDDLVARVDSALATRVQRGSAVLIVTGDHGEAFWEHGTLGHAAVGFDDERVRVPMVMCFAGARSINAALSTHADVLPTVLQYMGAPYGWDSLRIAGRSLLPAAMPNDSTRRAKTQPAGIEVVGAGFPTQANAYAIVTPHFKFWLRLRGADANTYIVDRVVDLHDRPIAMSDSAQRELSAAHAEISARRRGLLRTP